MLDPSGEAGVGGGAASPASFELGVQGGLTPPDPARGGGHNGLASPSVAPPSGDASPLVEDASPWRAGGEGGAVVVGEAGWGVWV